MREPISEARLLEIYWATLKPLFAYASRRCGGQRELAEDVLQEAWFRAVREWRVRGIPVNPERWLVAVIRNLVIDQLRRVEPMPLDAMSAAEVLHAVEQNDVSDSAEATLVVTDALTRLPKAEAQLLEAFHFERFKVSQLAATYGTSERAIEGRLRRARERLRHELEVTLKADGGLA